MALHEYLRLLRRRWRLVSLVVLVAVGAAVLATWTAPRLYTSKLQLFVSAQSNDVNVNNVYAGSLFTQQRVKSYVSVIQSSRTGALVKQDLALPESADAVAGEVNAQAPVDTVLINVAVVDPSPARAQAIANSIGRVFPTLVDQIETPKSGSPSPVRVSVVQPANLPVRPTSPKPRLNLALGLIVGLTLGVGAAVLRENLDTSIKGAQQVRDLIGVPLLGAINFDADAGKKPLIVVENPSSPRAEAIRQLRTNLQFVDIEHPLRSVVFTSSVPGEGKSSTLANLAITLTQAGLRVVVVEGDLRRPRIAEYLGLEGAVGVTSVLLGTASLDDALQPWGNGMLQVLASGPLPPNPSELLGSQGMHDLLVELEQRADIVLIDAPPLLPVTDAAVLGTLTSGLVMVIRSGSTRREQLMTAVATVEASGSALLGAVLNMLPLSGPDSYGYGYTYKAGPGTPRLTRPEPTTHSAPEEARSWSDRPPQSPSQPPPQASETNPYVVGNVGPSVPGPGQAEPYPGREA